MDELKKEVSMVSTGGRLLLFSLKMNPVLYLKHTHPYPNPSVRELFYFGRGHSICIALTQLQGSVFKICILKAFRVSEKLFTHSGAVKSPQKGLWLISWSLLFSGLF